MFITTKNPSAELAVRPWGTNGSQAIEIGELVIVVGSDTDCDQIAGAVEQARANLAAARAEDTLTPQGEPQ